MNKGRQRDNAAEDTDYAGKTPVAGGNGAGETSRTDGGDAAEKRGGVAHIMEEMRSQGVGRYPEWFDFFAMLVIFLAGTLAAGICMKIIGMAAPWMEREPLTAIVYTVQFAFSIGGVLVYSKLRGGTNMFRFSIRWYNASLVLLGLVLTVAAGVVMEPVLKLFPERYFEALDTAVGRGGWAILMLVLLAPVFEETLFRGLVLEPARRKWGASAAVFISALLFGLVHYPILPQMVNAFVMGVMLGYIYVLSCSLMPVIIIHAANNALAFLSLELTGTQNSDTRMLIGNDTVYWVVYAVCVVVFAGSLISMAAATTGKRRKRSEITAVFSSPESMENECGESETGNNKV